mmetsp:Transcript_74771/g.86811  ORF Transcript_74771/g.86811 Transcript_74771/m.86811 type:complete len:218 (+) Transcript_74771:19-672(+)
MLLNLALCLLVFCAVLSVSFADPKPLTWPAQWSSNFSELATYPLIGGLNTTGAFYYDWTNKRYRIDRANGKFDRYCGSAYWFRNTACNQYVVEGKRYIHFPEKDYCCYCCASEHGCGVLRPDWVSWGNFSGYVNSTEETPRLLQKWSLPGLQDNFYYATADDAAIPYEIDQLPNDFIYYKPETFRNTVDPSVFELPKQCSADTYCNTISTCTMARNF